VAIKTDFFYFSVQIGKESPLNDILANILRAVWLVFHMDFQWIFKKFEEISNGNFVLLQK